MAKKKATFLLKLQKLIAFLLFLDFLFLCGFKFKVKVATLTQLTIYTVLAVVLQQNTLCNRQAYAVAIAHFVFKACLGVSIPYVGEFFL